MSTDLDATEERFVDLDEQPGYRISNHGRAQSDVLKGSKLSRRTGIWRDLKPRPMKKCGHLYIQIRGRKFYVHRLVLEAFVGPPPPGMQGLHWDGDAKNNRVGNLRWGTALDNAQDALRLGRVIKGERHPWATVTESEVHEIRAMKERGMKVGQIARKIGRAHQFVSKITTGQRWKDAYPEVLR